MSSTEWREIDLHISAKQKWIRYPEKKERRKVNKYYGDFYFIMEILFFVAGEFFLGSYDGNQMLFNFMVALCP